MSVLLPSDTPENVRTNFQPAGLRTRFVAWFFDAIIVNLAIGFTFVQLVNRDTEFDGLFRDLLKQFDLHDQDWPIEVKTFGTCTIGICMLFWGPGSFFYFGLCELLWRGQTIGKRFCKIRVVRADGLASAPISIVIRNVFRLIDNLPILWIVPALSNRGQRLGDMVAGTIVVNDESEEQAEIRHHVPDHPVDAVRFHFDNSQLSRLARENFEVVEQILDRWKSIPPDQQVRLLDQMVGPLCKKMQTSAPPDADRLEFLEELLAAEYRRQDKHLR